MFEAIALWCRFPGEIASDLRQFHGIRIADWHHGDMLSYELLELCEFMDDDGRYKTALRQGEPSEFRAAVFATANEVAVLRAGQVHGVDGDQWGARFFLPPRLIREAQQEAEESQNARASIYAMADISRQEG